MRWVLLVIGVLMVAVGVVWTLQGFNILGGSFMSGQRGYAILGLVVGVIGLALVAFGVLRRTPAA
ncbi:MAG TPA: hypothetical protein VGS80_22950 [Ktedonobacterales bacterium]|jgi:hypothetical protein|nr:hypothetical protein [Ktedonobacterales bacterium]